MIAYSYSRLDSYSQCPLMFRLVYLDKIKGDDSDALEIGSASHEFFDQFVKNYPSKEPVEILAAKCFQKDPRKQGNFKDYLEICETFTKNYKLDPDYPIIKTELQIAFDSDWKLCGWFDKNVKFRSKIDYLAEPDRKPIKKIKIRDWKTGFYGPPDSSQLDIYMMSAASLYPDLEQVEVSYYFVKSGFSQVKILEVKDIEITRVQIDALIARIDSDKKFKAHPGSRCLNCPVAAFCTEKPSNLVAIDSQALAEQLGAEIALLEAQAKAKKKSLNAWCKEHGQVNTNGLIYSFWPRESMKVEMGPVLTACVKHGVDPSEVFNPDTTALRKILKNNHAFADEITPYLNVEVSYAFYSKKGNDE